MESDPCATNGREVTSAVTAVPVGGLFGLVWVLFYVVGFVFWLGWFWLGGLGVVHFL